MRAVRPVTRSLVGAALLAAALVPGSATAQDASPAGAASAVAPGARVRVTSPGGEPRVGTLVALTPDTLVARWAAGDSGAVALAQVTGLEVSRGLRARPWQGAGYGLLTGAGIGGVIGLVSYRGCGGRDNCIESGNAGTNAAAAALVIGAAGALVGGVVGALSRSEAWQPVAAGRRVRLAAPPAGRGVVAGAALAF
jgi:hypothetical protein